MSVTEAQPMIHLLGTHHSGGRIADLVCGTLGKPRPPTICGVTM
jgi:hypothetical protein